MVYHIGKGIFHIDPNGSIRQRQDGAVEGIAQLNGFPVLPAYGKGVVRFGQFQGIADLLGIADDIQAVEILSALVIQKGSGLGAAQQKQEDVFVFLRGKERRGKAGLSQGVGYGLNQGRKPHGVRSTGTYVDTVVVLMI